MHELAFTETGFTDWKHSGGEKGALAGHNGSLHHKAAAACWKDYQEQA